MVLTPHALVGAAVAGAVPEHPVTGFILGFLSHFILDAIPHWDYDLDFFKTNSLTVKDLFKLSLDTVLGLAVVGFFTPILIWGALGGLAPDALQYVSRKTNWRWLDPVQKFHLWIHSS